MALIFITGTDTGIGKTMAAAIVTEALEADYWKPVQAGLEEGTDSEWVAQRISNGTTRIHPEAFRLQMPASPHIAAREENIEVTVKAICERLPLTSNTLVVEGAGGLLVPLNDREFMADLANALDATVLLISRNVLGSINHSLLTAEACRQRGLKVGGWLFNDHYQAYEQEIAEWSGYPALGNIPYSESPDAAFVTRQAALLRDNLNQYLC